jgi:hypothetical protein
MREVERLSRLIDRFAEASRRSELHGALASLLPVGTDIDEVPRIDGAALDFGEQPEANIVVVQISGTTGLLDAGKALQGYGLHRVFCVERDGGGALISAEAVFVRS